MNLIYKPFLHLSDDEWLAVLEKSIDVNTIDGVSFPRFPSEEVQAQFVGSSNKAALREGKAFYSLVKGYSAALGASIDNESKLLDFGCGWGRYLRLFARDFGPDSMLGVDIDPDIVALNHQLGTPGQVSLISPTGDLPFSDGSFSHVIAYSVFTHLPEEIMLHWLKEIRRVAKPGAVFVCTVEPPRFLDFIASIDPTTESGWHRGLRLTAGDIPSLKVKAARGEFVYIPTGGGKHRDKEIYGDAVITKDYMLRVWGKFFDVRTYIDDPANFWQAVAVLQRS
jgi:SAM-dependent methyltransferase